ncbi:hypothetical protein TNCV_190811 [Trichonephila clavipes]|nr:hypothetical protein TNCV_190811 [Trichonephila clavipes]
MFTLQLTNQRAASKLSFMPNYFPSFRLAASSSILPLRGVYSDIDFHCHFLREFGYKRFISLAPVKSNFVSFSSTTFHSIMKKNVRHSWISSPQPMTNMPLSRMKNLHCPLQRTPDMGLRTAFTVQMPTEKRPFNFPICFYSSQFVLASSA